MSETIIGTLEDHFETGTEGVVWALQKDGDPSRDGLIFLSEGDRLKVFDEDGAAVLFDGPIMPDMKVGWTEYEQNPGHGQPAALGRWIHWTQSGWEPDAWARLFIRGKGQKRLRAELIQADKASP